MNMLERLNNVERPVWALFGDFITLLGVLGISIYVGGFSYIKAYFSEFRISTENLGGYEYAFFVFINEVLVSNILSLLLAILLASLFAMIFISVNAVFRPWFGYLLLVVMVSILTLSSAYIGACIGKKTALTNMVKSNDNHLPKIKVTPKHNSNLDLEVSHLLEDGADIRLLIDKSNSIVIFETLNSPDDPSDRDTYEIRKDQISTIIYK